MQSNYDKLAQMARELFLQYDRQELIEKFDLRCDGTYLYLPLLNEQYRVSTKDGSVEMETDGAFCPCTDHAIQVSFYDALCYPPRTPKLSGQWCPLYALQVTMSSPNADIFNQEYADAFAGNADRLRTACGRLGGVPVPIRAGADVACQLNVFPFFPVQLRFWDADDEFPAKLQFLWDKNSLDFMHFETLYYVMGIVLKKLLAVYQACE